MLLELAIVPLARGPSLSADVADLVKLIDSSGLDYRLTPAGTVIEGDWDQLVDLAKRCHLEMRKRTKRVITFMKVDDYDERTGRLTGMLESVEKRLASQSRSEDDSRREQPPPLGHSG